MSYCGEPPFPRALIEPEESRRSTTMARPSAPNPDDDKQKIADADWLVGDAPKAKPRAAPAAKGRPIADPDAHSYDVVGGDEVPAGANEPMPVPVPVIPTTPRKPKAKVEVQEPAEAVPAARVDQVWTRGAE